MILCEKRYILIEKVPGLLFKPIYSKGQGKVTIGQSSYYLKKKLPGPILDGFDLKSLKGHHRSTIIICEKRIF